MRLPPARFAVVSAFAVAWVSSIVLAVSANDAVPAAAAGVPGAPKPPQVIVLKSGKVVEGDIRIAQGGYEVTVSGGRVFLAESYIWFTAANRTDAYRQLRERYPDATANGHVELARWCIENRLYATAQEELRVALQLEPDHVAAQSTLRMIDEVLGNGSQRPTAPPDESALPDEPAVLGGLPTDTARIFVSRVQPLLVNRCGNASCHGAASQNAFTLQNVRPGAPAFRASTIQNLDAVRAQLSPERPSASPLLSAPQQIGHGGTRRPLFAGPAGAAQLKTLAAWAKLVARLPSPSGSADSPDTVSGRLQLVSGTTADAGPASNDAASAPIDPSNAPIAPPISDPTSEVLRRAIAEEPTDAFDPQSFNRRFGSRPGSLPTSSNGPTR